MEIIQKIDTVILRHDLMRNETHETIEQLVKIAQDFAIGFTEWCDNNYFRMGNTSFWSDSTDWDSNNKFTTKELLEIYKKEL